MDTLQEVRAVTLHHNDVLHHYRVHDDQERVDTLQEVRADTLHHDEKASLPIYFQCKYPATYLRLTLQSSPMHGKSRTYLGSPRQ